MVAATLSAYAADSRAAKYERIVARNPFGLNPPPPPAPPEPEEAPPEEVNVNLTGFSQRNNQSRVHLMIPPEGKDGKVQYLTMTANEKHDGIEIVNIDVANESVKIRNAGKLATLTFESNGLKRKAAPKSSKATAANKARTTASNSRTSTNRSNTSNRYSSTGNRVSAGSNRSAVSNRNSSSGRSGTSARSIPTRSTSRYSSGRNNNVVRAPVSPFLGTGEEIAIQQAIAAEAQVIANPGVRFPPLPNSSALRAAMGGGNAPAPGGQ